MGRILAALIASLWLTGGLAPASARNIDGVLVAESDTPKAGQSVALAIVMRPKPGWHGYWRNPGDAGTEPRVVWGLPTGAEAGELRYPVPETLSIQGIMNYVYEGEFALLTEVKLPPGLAPGSALPLRVKLDYLACTDQICVPESDELSLDLRVGDGRIEAAKRASFDRYRQALPRPLGSPARYEIVGGTVRIAVPLPASLPVSEPYFFPLTISALDHSAPQRLSRSGDLLIVEAPVSPAPAAFTALEGVLRIGEHQGLALIAQPGDVPAAGIPLGERDDNNGPAFVAALLGAVLGGLLLNIMPCVFPILGLKALSLARAGGDESAARREALAYFAGVVLVCVALGGVLLALRAAGVSAGWAFQLQDPRVVLFLFLLVTAIALNLAGLFELPGVGGGERLAGKGGTAGAFWTGALAAFVATPCTGPFMGAALGAALVLPTVAAIAIFAGLGVGLALPFLLIGFVPALRRRMPKPGPWMARLRRILSIPMFLTAAALAWMLSRQADWAGVAGAVVAAVLLAALLWWAGRRQRWLWITPAAVAMIAVPILLPVGQVSPASTLGLLGAEPFSQAKLEKLRREDRPVFVYFTADWCLTCKVNEKAVLARSDVGKAFEEKGIAVLIGDWTRGDAQIGRFLERHGRSGVPLYLYYAPEKEPAILPQLLTPAMMKAL